MAHHWALAFGYFTHIEKAFMWKVNKYYITNNMNADHRGGLGADLTRDSTRKATEMADKKRQYAE